MKREVQVRKIHQRMIRGLGLSRKQEKESGQVSLAFIKLCRSVRLRYHTLNLQFVVLSSCVKLERKVHDHTYVVVLDR